MSVRSSQDYACYKQIWVLRPCNGFWSIIYHSVEKPIEHPGRVLAIDGDRIDVQMTVDSACAACKAAAACGMGESRDKVVSLLTASASLYKEGEEVMVSIERRMGVKAATYAYIFPFFIMVAVLLIMFQIGFAETAAGLSALGSIGVYYIVLYFFRNRIEKEIIFKLRKI